MMFLLGMLWGAGLLWGFLEWKEWHEAGKPAEDDDDDNELGV